MVGAASPDKETVTPPLAGEEAVSQVEHEPAVDNRDMRDPQMLGDTLRSARMMMPDKPLSEFYDSQPGRFAHVPNYNPAPVDHAADRERELREREAQGDRFAKALLEGESLAEDPTD